MNHTQQLKFNALDQQHINALQRQGKAENTIDSYSRAGKIGDRQLFSFRAIAA